MMVQCTCTHHYWEHTRAIVVIENCAATHNIMKGKGNLEAVMKAYAVTALHQCIDDCAGMHDGGVTCEIDKGTRKCIANKTYKAKDLALYPFSKELTNIAEGVKLDPKVVYIEVTLDDRTMKFRMSQPGGTTSSSVDSQKSDSAVGVCPYWLVLAKSPVGVHPSDLNMEHATVTKKVGKAIVVVPYMHNKKEVKKGVLLSVVPKV